MKKKCVMFYCFIVLISGLVFDIGCKKSSSVQPRLPQGTFTLEVYCNGYPVFLPGSGIWDYVTYQGQYRITVTSSVGGALTRVYKKFYNTDGAFESTTQNPNFSLSGNFTHVWDYSIDYFFVAFGVGDYIELIVDITDSNGYTQTITATADINWP